MNTVEDTIALIGDLLSEMGRIGQAASANAATTIKELDMDSLELLEFLMLLDERTGVEVSTDEATLDTTLGEIAARISGSR